MKQWSILVAMVFLSSGCQANNLLFDVWRQGAIATLELRVIDEKKQPLEGVSASAESWMPAPNKNGTDEAVTDEKGFVRLSFPCITDGHYRLQKEGYYDTTRSFAMPSVNTDTIEESLLSYKWKQSYVQEETLRPIKAPAPMIAYQLFDAIVPERDKLIGFDLWKGDWVAPYGVGKCEDVKIRLNTEERQYGKKIKRETTSITFFFPQQGDGICICEAFPFSALRSAYTVDQSLHFHQTLTLKVPAFPHEVLPLSHYLVFRVRSEVADDGTILKTHYGKIYPIIDARGPELTIGAIYLNPRANDTNLEFNPKQNQAAKSQLRRYSLRRTFAP